MRKKTAGELNRFMAILHLVLSLGSGCFLWSICGGFVFSLLATVAMYCGIMYALVIDYDEEIKNANK